MFERILRRPVFHHSREILLRGNETDILSLYVMLLSGCLGFCFLSPLSSGNAFRDSFTSETFGRTVYGFASPQWSYLLLDGVSSFNLRSLGSATTSTFHAACPSLRPDVQLDAQLFLGYKPAHKSTGISTFIVGDKGSHCCGTSKGDAVTETPGNTGNGPVSLAVFPDRLVHLSCFKKKN